jgi:hypothetical protein
MLITYSFRKRQGPPASDHDLCSVFKIRVLVCVCGGRGWRLVAKVTGDLDWILVKDSHDIYTVCGSYQVSVNYSYEYKIAKVEGYPCNVLCQHVIAR